MKKKVKRIIIFLFIFNILLVVSTFIYGATQEKATETKDQTISSSNIDLAKMGKYLGAGLSIAISTLGAGIAVGNIGSAAIGAVSENSSNLGTSLIFIALGEGIVLWGIAGAFLIFFF